MGMPFLAGRKLDLQVSSGQLGEAFDKLTRNRSEIERVREFVIPFVNGVKAPSPWQNASVSDGDEIVFVVPISGG